MAKGDVIQDKDLIARIDKALENENSTAEEFYQLTREAFEKCIIQESERYNAMLNPKGFMWVGPEASKRATTIYSLRHPIWEYTRRSFFSSNEDYYIDEFRKVLTNFSKSTKHLWALGEDAPNALRPKEKLENGYKMFTSDWSEEQIREWDENDLKEMYESTFCEKYEKKDI